MCYSEDSLASLMIPGHASDDWPFQTLKLGEYISFARRAAGIVKAQRCEFAAAVAEVLGDRSVTERERTMLIQKAESIVFLGLETE